jgi:hypothetical protein
MPSYDLMCVQMPAVCAYLGLPLHWRAVLCGVLLLAVALTHLAALRPAAQVCTASRPQAVSKACRRSALLASRTSLYRSARPSTGLHMLRSQRHAWLLAHMLQMMRLKEDATLACLTEDALF